MPLRLTFINKWIANGLKKRRIASDGDDDADKKKKNADDDEDDDMLLINAMEWSSSSSSSYILCSVSHHSSNLLRLHLLFISFPFPLSQRQTVAPKKWKEKKEFLDSSGRREKESDVQIHTLHLNQTLDMIDKRRSERQEERNRRNK